MFKQLIVLSILFLVCLCSASAEVVYYARFANHSVCIDDSGYNNHGAYYNINFDIGIKNGAAIFNGIDSRIVIQNPEELSFTDGSTDEPFSTAFWVNRHGSGVDDPIISKGWEQPECEYIISTIGETPRQSIVLYDNTTGYQLSCQTEKYLYEYTEYNDWVHVFITYDGSSDVSGLNIYINGVLQDCIRSGHPGYIAMDTSSSNLQIGRASYEGPRHFFNGKLDELIFYDTELCLSEVEFIYNSYMFEGYTMMVLDKDLISVNKNISVYRNNEYVQTVEYGETFNISNVYNYSFILHEDNFDRFSHIENITDTSINGITYLVYAFVLIGIIALLIYMYRRF